MKYFNYMFCQGYMNYPPAAYVVTFARLYSYGFSLFLSLFLLLSLLLSLSLSLFLSLYLSLFLPPSLSLPSSFSLFAGYLVRLLLLLCYISMAMCPIE
jgi:hypothetical protein